jgi:RING finger/CHY zinc finger protein 1
MNETNLECAHTKRKCELYTTCCSSYFVCAKCHDKVKFDNETIVDKKHRLDNISVTKLKCAECKTVQPISHKCISCDIDFLKNCCKKCVLFDEVDINVECADCKNKHIDKFRIFQQCKTCGSNNVLKTFITK